MPNLDPGTHVADCDCMDCGKEVKVKLNKNGNAYYYCNWVNVGTGNNCGSHHRFGKDKSQQMQRDYLAARAAYNHSEKTNHDQIHHSPPEVPEHAERPESARDQAAGNGAGHDHLADPEPAPSSGGGWGLLDL